MSDDPRERKVLGPNQRKILDLVASVTQESGGWVPLRSLTGENSAETTPVSQSHIVSVRASVRKLVDMGLLERRGGGGHHQQVELRVPRPVFERLVDGLCALIVGYTVMLEKVRQVSNHDLATSHIARIGLHERCFGLRMALCLAMDWDPATEADVGGRADGYVTDWRYRHAPGNGVVSSLEEVPVAAGSSPAEGDDGAPS